MKPKKKKKPSLHRLLDNEFENSRQNGKKSITVNSLVQKFQTHPKLKRKSKIRKKRAIKSTCFAIRKEWRDRSPVQILLVDYRDSQIFAYKPYDSKDLSDLRLFNDEKRFNLKRTESKINGYKDLVNAGVSAKILPKPSRRRLSLPE